MSWLLERMAGYDERLCIRDKHGDHSYREFVGLILSYKKELEASIKVPSVVVLYSSGDIRAIACFLGLYALDCVIVPVVSQVRDELDSRILISDADYVVGIKDDGSLNVEMREGARKERSGLVEKLISDRAAGLVLFSSGSTGEPKAMIRDLRRFVDAYKTKKRNSLSILLMLMFDHIGGLNTVISILAAGATLVIPAARTPDAIAEAIQNYRVNVLPASPTFLNLLLLSGQIEQKDFGSVKLITYGTEPMPQSLLGRIKKALPGAKLTQTFGTSETGIIHTQSRSSDSLEISFDDTDQKIRLVDGELQIKSAIQILGYLNSDESKLTDDGWFKTGDLVEDVGGGYYKIIGRKSDVINVGGEKVLPGEVESVLMEIDGIADATVYGVRNAITGQVVAADVVLEAGRDEAHYKSKIREYCKQRLDAYKIPIKIKFVASSMYSKRFKKTRQKSES